jgi:hypothetical protein
VVLVNDVLARFEGQGSDGAGFFVAGLLQFMCDAAPSTGIVPGRAVVRTANASGALTDAMTWDSSQAGTATGAMRSSSDIGGVGYATGAGGTVTQATNKSTGVTLNKVCGQITMNAASLAAGATVGFTVTNSAVAISDVIVLNIRSGATVNSYRTQGGAVAAGSFRVEITNTSGGALAEAVVLNFAVIKAVTA